VRVLSVRTRSGAGRSASTSGTWRPCWRRRAWTCARCRRASAATPAGWRRACRWRAATCWCWWAATARCSTRCRRAAPAVTQGGLLTETLAQDVFSSTRALALGMLGEQCAANCRDGASVQAPGRGGVLPAKGLWRRSGAGSGGCLALIGRAVAGRRLLTAVRRLQGSGFSRGPACACRTLPDCLWCCRSWAGLTPLPGRPRASCNGRTGRRPRACRCARSPAAAATRSPPIAACGPPRRPRTPSARSAPRRRARPPAHAHCCSLAAPATFVVDAVFI
jgi:hypothetical protein